MQTYSYNIGTIAEVVGGELICNNFEDKDVTDILIDSRRLISAEHCVFIALVTKKNDGHRYIEELYQKGIRNFIISNPDFHHESCNCILVKDSLLALQKLTAHHRRKFDIPVIGITGSNGKTIVKEWLFQLLSPEYTITRSPKSYNSQVGVPLSVWQLKEESQMGIFEAGISEPEEMEKLQNIINPSIGIYTNIGQAHGENFINTTQKAGEKLKLFTRVKTLIYSPDYPEIQETIIRSELLRKIKAFTWSRKQDADLRVKTVTRNKDNTSNLTGIYNGNEISIIIPFTNDASVENAIICWAAPSIYCFNLYD